jgi:tetratricopeptide (TPR) repeat protein
LRLLNRAVKQQHKDKDDASDDAAAAVLAQALTLRAQIFVLLGRYDRAQRDYARNSNSGAGKLKKQRELKQAIRTKQRAITLHAMAQHQQCMHALTQLIDTLSPQSTYLRLLRADSALKLGYFGWVRHDTAHVLHAEPNNTRAVLLLALASYRIAGQLDAALGNVRHCLRINANDTHCRKAFGTLNAISSAQHQALELEASGQFGEATFVYTRMLEADAKGPFVRTIRRKLCALFLQAERYKETIDACHAASLADRDLTSRDDTTAFCTLHLNIATALFRLERFKAARAEVLHAERIDPRDPRVHALKQLIDDAQKEDEVRDYYAVLNVSRSANQTEIKRAYRRASLKWHPDKSKAPNAPEMFHAIVEAYEILGNEQLRAQYDAGEHVTPEAAQKASTFKYEFHVNKEDLKQKSDDGKVKAWFMNEEGEKEWTELEVKEQPKQAAKPVQMHCCVPFKRELDKARQRAVE